MFFCSPHVSVFLVTRTSCFILVLGFSRASQFILPPVNLTPLKLAASPLVVSTCVSLPHSAFRTGASPLTQFFHFTLQSLCSRFSLNVFAPHKVLYLLCFCLIFYFLYCTLIFPPFSAFFCRYLGFGAHIFVTRFFLVLGSKAFTNLNSCLTAFMDNVNIIW